MKVLLTDTLLNRQLYLWPYSAFFHSCKQTFPIGGREHSQSLRVVCRLFLKALLSGHSQEHPLLVADLRFLGLAMTKQMTNLQMDSFSINPLSPRINIQILQTGLHTFPLRIS